MASKILQFGEIATYEHNKAIILNIKVTEKTYFQKRTSRPNL
jgi:hypothetical protein